jgi:2-C-methyl-D-erythritol 4-phosphate cytidylyltransferase/2-C-methyl-D-erythritol 2,4-cyclodiphosphate synthase
VDCAAPGKRLGAPAMEAPSPAPGQGFAAVIVAAGKGLRAGQALPKQFAAWRGKPLLRHSAEALAKAGAHPIAVAIPEGAENAANEALRGIAGIRLVTGGATRQLSVGAALAALEVDSPERVLIHDAARATLPQPVIARLLAALESHPGAIPVLPVVDSLARDEAGLMAGSAARDGLRRVQTPQAFRFAPILAAHRAWSGEQSAGDDAQVARAAGLEVALVEGDERLKKLTYAEDFMDDLPAVRIGTGFDVHRLAEGEELWLGGVRIAHDKGLAGHSDADVAIHALVDALLGAAGAGDIGLHFPPSDPQWKDAPSSKFLTHAVGLVAEAGYRVGNVDLTIICEAPRIGPHREDLRARLAQLMGVDIGCVSVKATTTEKLGFTGRGEGIAAQAVATILCNQ